MTSNFEEKTEMLNDFCTLIEDLARQLHGFHQEYWKVGGQWRDCAHPICKMNQLKTLKVLERHFVEGEG